MAKPTTFTRVRDGETKTRIAHTPAEAVKLRFEGWTEVTDAKRLKAAAKSEDKPAASTGGKPEQPAS